MQIADAWCGAWWRGTWAIEQPAADAKRLCSFDIGNQVVDKDASARLQAERSSGGQIGARIWLGEAN